MQAIMSGEHIAGLRLEEPDYDVTRAVLAATHTFIADAAPPGQFLVDDYTLLAAQLTTRFSRKTREAVESSDDLSTASKQLYLDLDLNEVATLRQACVLAGRSLLQAEGIDLALQAIPEEALAELRGQPDRRFVLLELRALGLLRQADVLYDYTNRLDACLGTEGSDQSS